MSQEQSLAHGPSSLGGEEDASGTATRMEAVSEKSSSSSGDRLSHPRGDPAHSCSNSFVSASNMRWTVLWPLAMNRYVPQMYGVWRHPLRAPSVKENTSPGEETILTLLRSLLGHGYCLFYNTAQIILHNGF